MNGEEAEHEVSQTMQKRKTGFKDAIENYALRIIRLYESFPKRGAVHVTTHQLRRSGTSPGAHYRKACRAESDTDFISKIEGGLRRA